MTALYFLRPRRQAVPPANPEEPSSSSGLVNPRHGREFDRIPDRAKEERKELQTIDD